MEPYGLIKGESNAAYHANNAVSASKLKTFMESPYSYFRHHIEKSITKKETAAMRFGSAAHEYILEPQEFFARNAVEQRESGKKTLSTGDFIKIKEMAYAIGGNRTACLLLADGYPELSWRIRTEAGYDMQCRTDWFGSATPELCEELATSGITIEPGQPYIVDIKTTADLPAWFRSNYGNEFYKYKYHIQNVFYRAVVNTIRKQRGEEMCRHFFFVAIEKSAPNECAVVVQDESSLAHAEAQLKHLLRKLSGCYASGHWLGYRDRGVMLAGVPEHIAQKETKEFLE